MDNATDTKGTLADLTDLLAAMRANHPTLGDWTSLPTFGGDEPKNTAGVWSWDATFAIVGTCPTDVRIVPRAIFA
jgi:hypothetical protein